MREGGGERERVNVFGKEGEKREGVELVRDWSALQCAGCLRRPRLTPFPPCRAARAPLLPLSRFQPVVVPEPTVDETFEILQGEGGSRGH